MKGQEGALECLCNSEGKSQQESLCLQDKGLKCLGGFRFLPEMRTLFCQVSLRNFLGGNRCSRLSQIIQLSSKNHTVPPGSENGE